MPIVFRNAGAWGAGKGSRLTSLEADGNFWDHEQRLDTIEGESGRSIDFVEPGGAFFTIHYTDATTQIVGLPTAAFTARGEWLNNTSYAALDVVTVRGLGTFLVLDAHTTPAAPAPFDPAETTTAGPVYQQMGGRAVTQPGFPYRFAEVSTGSPASGELSLDDVPVDATQLSLSTTTDDGSSIGAFLATWDDTDALVRGRVYIVDGSAPENFAIFDIVGDGNVTGIAADFPVSHVASGGTFDANAWLSVLFVPAPPTTALASTVDEVSTTTYSPTVAAGGVYHRCTHASGCEVSVPSFATAAFPEGSELHFRQCTSATISFVEGDTDVVINGMAGFLNETDGEGAVVTLKNVGTSEWDLFGRLASSATA